MTRSMSTRIDALEPLAKQTEEKGEPVGRFALTTRLKNIRLSASQLFLNCVFDRISRILGGIDSFVSGFVQLFASFFSRTLFAAGSGESTQKGANEQNTFNHFHIFLYLVIGSDIERDSVQRQRAIE